MPLHSVDPLEQDERDHLRDEMRRKRQAQVDYAQGLRDLADFLDSRPDLLAPSATGVTVYFWAHVEGGDDIAATFEEKALSLGDERTDSVAGSYFNSTVEFGPHKFQVTRPINLDTPSAAKPPHPLA